MTVRALVFDFDGLIIDTETSEFESVRQAFVEHGATMTRQRWGTRIGTRGPHWLDELEADVGPVADRDAVHLAHRVRHHQRVVAEAPARGLVEMLDNARARGLQLAVASSSTREWVAGHLERLGLLERFAFLSCCGAGVPAKPEPDCYRAACAALGVAAADAVAFEDSPHGVAAAKGAGLRCIAVPGPMTRDLDLSAADLVVASLEDVDLGALPWPS